MIKVDRGQAIVPAVFGSTKTTSERAKAAAFFKALAAAQAAAPAAPVKPKPPAKGKKTAKGKQKQPKGKKKKTKSFTFAVFKDASIKAALNQLFQGKCAYCESRYAAMQPMDVEHFRPKSEVTELDGSKCMGYYWLAAEWSNLLPSCIDCNRPRKHPDIKTGKPVTLGKSTLFPLAPNSARAAAEQPVDSEKPLLLDPCRDDPTQYVRFAEGIVEAHIGPEAPPDALPRVDVSVRVYGLNRTELVQERRRILLNLRRRFHQVRRLTKVLADTRAAPAGSAPPGIVLMIEDLISHEMEAISAMKGVVEPYSLMVRQEIAAFERELKPPGA